MENILYFVDVCKATNVTLNTIFSHSLQREVEEKIYENGSLDEDDDSKSCSSKRSYILCKEEDGTECQNSETLSNKYVSCPSCNECFISSKGLQEHFDVAPKCKPKDEKPHKTTIKNDEKCVDVVEKKIKAEILDNEHEFVRGKVIKGKRKFLCNYCGKNYTRKNGLDRHIMSHTGTKPFECKECGKCYITKNTLKTHMLIHTGIKTHKCEICNKSFLQSSHLNYHMRRHAGEKPHTCAFCGKGFLSTYHLERHKLMHTGVKPFK